MYTILIRLNDVSVNLPSSEQLNMPVRCTPCKGPNETLTDHLKLIVKRRLLPWRIIHPTVYVLCKD